MIAPVAGSLGGVVVVVAVVVVKGSCFGFGRSARNLLVIVLVIG